VQKNKVKKQGIILLITLFFISAISVLILQNLEDSESFINELSYDSQLAQLKITSNNVQEQIISIVNKNQEYIDDILEQAPTLPLAYGNINLIISLDYFNTDENCNVNALKTQEDIVSLCGEDISYKIEDKYTFVNTIKDYNITSEQQLLYVINQYKREVNDNQIDSIKDQFSYLSLDSNDTESTYLKCDFEINLENNISAKSFFVFKVGSTNILNSDFYLK